MGHVGVMLIPTDEHKVDEDSHVTLVYAGKYDPAETVKYNQLKLQTQLMARTYEPFVARSVAPAWFGEGDERVPVITLTAPLLFAMRQWVAPFNASQHKEFRPHMTVPRMPRPSEMRPYIYIEKIAFWINDERSTWMLGNGKAL